MQQACAIDGCQKRSYCRGWCTMHYARYRQHGDPLIVLRGPALCEVKGCSELRVARGWCEIHYARWKYHGNPLAGKQSPPKAKRECKVEDCSRSARAHGMCGMHYKRWKTHGDPLVVMGHSGKPLHEDRPCLVEGCPSVAHSHGWCSKHYQRWKAHGTPTPPPPKLKICAIEGCGRKAIARGWCQRHYNRWNLHGDPVAPPRPRKPAPSKRPSSDHRIGARYLDRHGYIRIYVPPEERPPNDRRHTFPEHRIVMARHLGRHLTADESVHHKNGDRADNRLSNLELWSGKHPSTQRVEDLVKYAEEIQALYGHGRETLAHCRTCSCFSA